MALRKRGSSRYRQCPAAAVNRLRKSITCRCLPGSASSITGMGQPVTVVQKASSKPGIVRFEINRSITGMGHERYRSAEDALDDTPCDELARRLFTHGGVEYVHINSNVITVEAGFGADVSSLKQIVEDLFIYYRPGVEVASFEPAAEASE